MIINFKDAKNKLEREHIQLKEAKTKKPYCFHRKILVDVEYEKAECEDCGELLSPMWVLTKMMRAEARWKNLRTYYLEAARAFENKRRFKCRHCKKINVLPTPKDTKKTYSI